MQKKTLHQEKDQKYFSSHLGIEPRTFGLEVQRAILCANGTPHDKFPFLPDMNQTRYYA